MPIIYMYACGTVVGSSYESTIVGVDITAMNLFPLTPR